MDGGPVRPRGGGIGLSAGRELARHVPGGCFCGEHIAFSLSHQPRLSAAYHDVKAESVDSQLSHRCRPPDPLTHALTQAIQR